MFPLPFLGFAANQTPSVCCADSPLSEGAFPLLRAKQASLPEGGGIAKQ